MRDDSVLGVSPLAFPWTGFDPFLFIAHHVDDYPAGNEAMAPVASLAGRAIGSDFAGKDGWNMYHGDVVPGFPQHPHRGFETVTIVRRGLIDHSDSLGAVARFGAGDAQWLTAGKGIVHSEMFPLLERERGNPVELFQIWVNLPRARKLVEPHFSMFWRDAVPRVEARDAAGRTTEVTVVAGRLGDATPPSPPPSSWASDPASDLAIWTIRMAPSAEWTLPRAAAGTSRTLYLFGRGGLRIGDRVIAKRSLVQLRPDADVTLQNGPDEAEILLLQGRPIGEPVVQHGPFVMNSPVEIAQAIADYRRTQFGGWPWPSDGPVLPRNAGRFARHPDGRVEQADEATPPAAVAARRSP